MFINKLFIFLLISSSNAFAWSEVINTTTPIKAIHLNELRNVINLKRQCYGLPNVIWTDNTLTEKITKIKSTHFQEIRNAINSLHDDCTAGLCSGGSGNFSLANKAWSELINNGASIKASHINELRTILDNITCTPYTYNWLVGSYDVCSNGTGTWSYSAFGSCSGGYGYWSYGGWGGCSVSCDAGVQYRGASCLPAASSGVQYRNPTCNFSMNSGAQARSVQCQRSDSLIMADSFCNPLTKPTNTQVCTPNNSAVCGPTYLTAQSCTPASAGCSTGPANAQGCNNGPCCNSVNESSNMCLGYSFTAAAYGTWSDPMAMAILAINAAAACNTFNPGRCQNGSANVIFITPCTACMLQYVTCQCN